MNYTQSIGCYVELECMCSFIKLGYTCCIPYGNDAKYDFIADINGKFIRIQCKSPVLIKDTKDRNVVSSLMLSLRNATTNTKETVTHGYTEDQVDYFATYYNDNTYVIPIKDTGSSSFTLRLIEPKNNIGNDMFHAAEDYKIENVFNESKEYLDSKSKYDNRLIHRDDKEDSYCTNCGCSITGEGITGLCIDCWHKTTRKAERPSKDELEKMIYTIPFTTIAKQYDVTDNAVRKWCKSYELPYKKSEIKQQNNSNQ